MTYGQWVQVRTSSLTMTGNKQEKTLAAKNTIKNDLKITQKCTWD